MTGSGGRFLGAMVVVGALLSSCADGTVPAAGTVPDTTPAASSPPQTVGEAPTSCDDEALRAAGAGSEFALLTTPASGGQVSASFRAIGCANVADAEVGWRLRDARGRELAAGSTPASCGGGCVGSFGFDVTLDETVDLPASATLEVFPAANAADAPAPLAAVPFVISDGQQAAAAADAGGAGVCDDLAFQEEGAEMAFIFPVAPTAGARLASGFSATGCANVFEATVHWRLRGAGGDAMAEGFTTASCGTGCVGKFAFDVPYASSAGEPEIGNLEMFTLSARDGTEELLVTIPVVLE